MSKEVLDAIWHILLVAVPIMGAAIIQMLRDQNKRITEIHACVDRRFDAIGKAHQVRHEENIQRLARLEQGQGYVEGRFEVVERKLDAVLVVERSR